MDFKKETRIYLENENGRYAEVVIEYEGNNVYNITHTVVAEAHRGEGLAGKLVDEAVNFINLQNGKIKASCSYANARLKKQGIIYS